MPSAFSGGRTRRAREQAGEGAQQVALLQPQVGVEHRGGRGLVRAGVDQDPQGAVGEQGQRDAAVAAQGRGLLGGGELMPGRRRQGLVVGRR